MHQLVPLLITYIVSQYMIFKFGDSLIMNVSLSILSSVMVGGGSAIAMPTNPKYCVVDFLFRLKHIWGRKWAVTYTT